MKSGSKYNKLHNYSIAFLVIGCIIIFICGINIFINLAYRFSSASSKSADGFTIEKYKIILNVSENNTIDVKEYITVNFYEKGHHGIYRFIPEWLEYTGKDHNTISRKSKISNLVSYSDNYSISTVKGKKRIKLGNANITLPTGPHTYAIGYTYDMGADPYDNFDEFIFHAFGDFWGTRINNATIEIHLPKNANVDNNIHFFADKYRKKDITSYVDYTVSGNIIYAKLSSNYSLNNSLTIDFELPNDYFSNKTNNYGSLSLLFCIICIAFAVISFLLWIKNGKDLDKVPETVEFYPPEQLDASQIGYLYKQDTGRKLSIALIVELASKGFIKIIESQDKKKQTIVKSNYTDLNKAINREIKISKIRDYTQEFNLDFSIKNLKNWNSIKEFFHEFITFSNSNKDLKNWNLMNIYFKDKNEVTITNNFEDFYTEADYLIQHNYIKIEYDTLNNYSNSELENLKQSLIKNEFKEKPKMTKNEELVYNQLFKYADETVLSENYSFYEVFAKVARNVRNEFDDKINDLQAYKSMLVSSLGFAICSLLWGLAYFVIEDLNTHLSFIYYLAAISNIVTLVFSILMKRKNSYGEQIKSKIIGFKNYIEIAKKSQLDMLVEENPNYFYEILPYAYVLGVSKKWIKKFENIPIPTYDMGNFNYYDVNSLDTLSTSVYYPSSSSSSGSSFGCGGGCSSCGGGCSSCGGGGSW